MQDSDLPDIEKISTGWSNGISQSSKTWLPQSARFMRGLEIFNDTDSVTLKPKPILDSASTVTDLVKWIVPAFPYEADGVRYAYGDSGKIYRIASNTWSLDHTVGSGSPAGQGMCVLTDELFYATSTTIGRAFQLSTESKTYNDDFFTDGINNIDINFSASGQTYTTPISISETQTNTLYFGSGNTASGNTAKLAFDPVTVIQLFVTAKGTGNWTITMHDVNNNNLGTVTVANGSLTNGQMNTWTFGSPIRINIGSIYHIHLTSTVNDGTVQTATSSDFGTAQVKTQFGILIADSRFHPQIQFTNGVTGILVTGNEHYLSVYDNTTYNPNKITLTPGYSVRAIAKINGYIAAFCWPGPDITTRSDGMIHFWDGIQPYYNFARPVQEGNPNASFPFKNRLFGIFGSTGNIEIAPDEQSPFRKIQPIPKLTLGYAGEVLPGAIDVFQSKALFGFSRTNDPNTGTYNDPSAGNHVAGDTYTPPVGVEEGIYEFGNQSDRQIVYTQVSTEVMTFSWTPSTTIANPLNNFTIGCIAAFGNDCYFSYKDGTSFYVDRVNTKNNASSFGSYESLISDETFNKIQQFKQEPAKSKMGLKVRTTFQSLPTGCTVTSKWRINRDSAWTFGNTATSGATEAAANIGGMAGRRYKEIEYGFDVTSTGSYPVITSCGLFFRPLPQEVGGKSL